MSEDQDKESKTEDPTDKRMRDAIEKGNVPFSREVLMFTSALALYLYFTFFVPSGMQHLTEALKDVFEQMDQWRLNTRPDSLSIFTRLGWAMAGFLAPALILVMTFGIAGAVVQTKPNPVLERVRPQGSRVSVFKGWNRIFGIQGLVEFAKSLFKIGVISLIMFFVLRNDFYSAIDAMFTDPQAIFERMSGVVKQILQVILLSTALIAILDVFWTRHHWYTEIRMTKQEVKDELKQAQGDPIIKARQRSIARDRARRRMMNNVPRATLVIANPTHYAVALRYDRDESDAPIVVAKGTDLVALKIREIAEENGVPVFEDPPLARSMFAQVSVDNVIPTVFYKAVAELIHRVYATQPQQKRVQ